MTRSAPDVTAVDTAAPTGLPLAVGHLDALESEAVHIFREVAAEFERPVLLFSGGKDSIVMLHLALKAFWPAPVPFGLLHVDTGHNFPEVLAYRDRTVAEHGLRLEVAQRPGLHRRRPAARAPGRHPQPAADRAAARRDHRAPVRRGLRRRPPRRGEGPGQGAGLLAARRVRAVGSAPPASGAVVAVQRPAPPRRARARLPAVELDRARRLAVHRARARSSCRAIYFAHEREVFQRDGMWLTAGDWGGPTRRRGGRRRAVVRYRTVGDMSCTGAVDSDRGDRRRRSSPRSPPPRSPSAARPAPTTSMSEAAMEDRKREGYF